MRWHKKKILTSFENICSIYINDNDCTAINLLTIVSSEIFVNLKEFLSYIKFQCVWLKTLMIIIILHDERQKNYKKKYLNKEV